MQCYCFYSTYERMAMNQPDVVLKMTPKERPRTAIPRAMAQLNMPPHEFGRQFPHAIWYEICGDVASFEQVDMWDSDKMAYVPDWETSEQLLHAIRQMGRNP